MVLQTFQLHIAVTFHGSNGNGVAMVQPSGVNCHCWGTILTCKTNVRRPPIVGRGGGVSEGSHQLLLFSYFPLFLPFRFPGIVCLFVVVVVVVVVVVECFFFGGGGGGAGTCPMSPRMYIQLFLFVNDCWLTYRATPLFSFMDKSNRIRYLTTILTFHFTSPLGQIFTLNVALRLRGFHCSFLWVQLFLYVRNICVDGIIDMNSLWFFSLMFSLCHRVTSKLNFC